MDEMQFDPESSFTDEITSKEEAQSAVMYLSHNEVGFRDTLYHDGKSYDEIQNIVRRIWRNLLKSCSRVGYSDFRTKAKEKQYGLRK